MKLNVLIIILFFVVSCGHNKDAATAVATVLETQWRCEFSGYGELKKCSAFGCSTFTSRDYLCLSSDWQSCKASVSGSYKTTGCKNFNWTAIEEAE